MPPDIADLIEFNEFTARRPNHIEGRPVQLENDEVWQFPLPMMNIRLSLDPESQPTAGPSSRDTNRHFSRNYWDKQTAFEERWTSMVPPAEDADFTVWVEDIIVKVKLIFPLAANLLRRNYNLTDNQLSDLLMIRPADPVNIRMWGEISRILLGLGPKPAAAGSN